MPDLDGIYPWVLAGHVIGVVVWMAGLLYLPRLFVYHAEAKPGSELSETFKIMERRLLRIIMNPAMVLTWGLGPWLVYLGDWWSDGWLHAKFVLIVVLSVFHHVLARWRKAFADDANTRPAKVYRIANEVPTLCLIGIVILAIVKPF